MLSASRFGLLGALTLSLGALGCGEAASSTCNVDCEGGKCNTTCAANASCDVKCPKGDCKPEPKDKGKDKDKGAEPEKKSDKKDDKAKK